MFCKSMFAAAPYALDHLCILQPFPACDEIPPESSCSSPENIILGTLIVSPGASLAEGFYRPLSAPREAWHFALAAPPSDAEHKILDLGFDTSGRFNAVVFWYELDLGGGHRLSTGPRATAAGV